MSSPILELFTYSTLDSSPNWEEIIATQPCGYLGRRCVKVRKSQPEISIGTCSIHYGAKERKDLIICPHRFLERGQIFLDCLHLLRHHEPGNEIHRIAELEIPGGNVDYFLVSVRNQRVVDFVGVELQALDTTGSLWSARQEFLASQGLPTTLREDADDTYGINWKMTAKTTLVQLHHKIQTFENLNKQLVLVLQDRLVDYMRQEFNFSHIQDAQSGHSMQFHSYQLQTASNGFRIQLTKRLSTDANGIGIALGLQSSPHIELDILRTKLESKLSAQTLLKI